MNVWDSLNSKLFVFILLINEDAEALRQLFENFSDSDIELRGDEVGDIDNEFATAKDFCKMV